MNKNYKNLLNASLKGADLYELADLSADYLNNPIVIINTSYNIIAYSKNKKSKDEIWLEATKRGYITVEFTSTLNHWDDIVGNYKYFDVKEISDKTRRFIRLIYKNKVVGFLNVLEEYSKLIDIDDDKLEFVSSLLAKELANLDRNQMIINEEELLYELLTNKFVDRLHFLSRIEGSPISKRHYFLAACIDFKSLISYNAADDEIQDNLRLIFKDVTSIFFDKQLVILIENKNFDIKALDSFLKKFDLNMGISDSFDDLFSFYDHLQEAKAALKLKDLAMNNYNFIYFEEIKSFYIYEFFTPKDLLRFTNDKIIKLKHYDEKNDTDYVETLRIYLLYHKSINMCANKLFVHRNTVNYRIAKIKELTDLSVSLKNIPSIL